MSGRIDYGDWGAACDKLIQQFAAGAWRHGLSTEECIAKAKGYGGFPASITSRLPPKERKKYGDSLDTFYPYYIVQKRLKNVHHLIVDSKGEPLKPRLIYNVEYGVGEGETDEQGRPVRPSKRGLWLFHKNLTHRDAVPTRALYRGREKDSHPDKRYLDAVILVLKDKPAETTVEDVYDEILRAI